MKTADSFILTGARTSRAASTMGSRGAAISVLGALLLLLLPSCGDDGDPEDTDTDASASANAVTGDSTGGTTTDVTTDTSTGVGSGSTSAEGTSSGSSGSTSGSTGDPTGDPVDRCAESVLTWENFAEGFMLSWCTGCHHSELPLAQRAGAPCGINLDTHASASTFAPLVKLRALDWKDIQGIKPMPPAALIPDEELALLREWIECGARGPETGGSALCCPDPAPDESCG